MSGRPPYTPSGLYESLVMPLGLTHAPAGIQGQAVDNVFRDLLNRFVMLVLSREEEAHVKQVLQALQCLLHHQLFVRAEVATQRLLS